MTGADAAPLLELRALRKVFLTSGSVAVEALRGITLTIRAGEFVAIMGQSGSGKSTLMNILGLLDSPTGGLYRIAGRDTAGLDRDAVAALRRQTFGFVFQRYNLIETLDVIENVEVPAVYAGMPPVARRARAAALLSRLGLGDRLHHRPAQLSGGQQQRVSIARALMTGGRIVLADEPTGALDSATGAEVMALLRSLSEAGRTIILITHDREIAAVADRTVEIRDGLIVHETRPKGRDLSATMQAPPPAPPGRRSRLADLREALVSGTRALGASPVRTILTLLGFVIGVASVVALLAIGEGARQDVVARMATFGTNRLYVNPGGERSRGVGGRLMPEDVAVVRAVPNVAAAMPYLTGKVTVRAGNVDVRTQGVAVSAAYQRILSWPVEAGV
ncbi:MAG: ATP-binding cassette domain-containing protein, partial [Microvirga sp.]